MIGEVRHMVERLEDDEGLRGFVERVECGGAVAVEPVADGGRAFVVRRLAARTSRPVVVVAETQRAQDILADDLEGYEGLFDDVSVRIFSFPPWDEGAREGGPPSVDSVVDRLTALAGLSDEGTARVLVTCVDALLQKTLSPAALRSRTLEIRPGARIEMAELLRSLVDWGYAHEYQVNGPGEFAVRGGIVDVFSPCFDDPVRIEFVGDEVETLRAFDLTTQRTSGPRDRAVLSPPGELGLLRRDPGTAAALWEHFPAETILVWARPHAILEQIARFEDAGGMHELNVPWAEARAALGALVGRRIELREGAGDAVIDVDAEVVELDIQALEPWASAPGGEAPAEGVDDARRRLFFQQFARWERQGYRIDVCCNNEGERQRFREILDEMQVSTRRVRDHLARISQGFVYPAGRWVVVTDAEIFARYRSRRPRRLRRKVLAQEVAPLGGLEDLAPGDFVVHVQHGIGRYEGLRELEFDGRVQEVLAVEYAEGARLYVPVDQCHLLSRYVGAGRRIPDLHRLGGGRWLRSKAQAQRAVEDLAADLLRVQAVRQTRSGHAYPPDTPWQREFEAAFPYEETPDQHEAIDEVKRDLESARPADRLICGDVGYGKTEVAMRAAFKVVMDGRQAAVLVPTTVLAQQHFETFCERTADYPVRVEVLSRFRSRREQRRVVADLTRGAVDIVIGTHRLLQRDVRFHDLGLVVIDEEQRFGVLDKERLKRMREMVDVITLTATPIPRTLYLALSGARDMSTIQTPPQDRLPVVTRVAQYSDALVRESILREIQRGGQVYYLHNRVRTIEAVAERLRDLVPEASFEVGHGQMHERDLENVMSRFVRGEFDVLVCTTIIESGLDIQNVNTIIIDRADRFGLSDLYQLRGRVGRYRVQAHAYLLIPRHGVLLDTARKRIGAIRQYSNLGSGFRIAMRDLEIRGTGNILGREQSGHITAVGFDFYCRLLREAVARMKGEPVRARPDVTVRLDFLDARAAPPEPGRATAMIPRAYIEEEVLRIDAYRRMAEIAEEEEIAPLRAEFEDRFGAVPEPVALLLEIARLRCLAAEAGFDAVETDGDRIILSRRSQLFQVGGRFPRLRSAGAAGRIAEIRKLLHSIRRAAARGGGRGAPLRSPQRAGAGEGR